MNPEDRAVYLTFDDGPIPEATPFILDTLARFNAKATFFVVGQNVQRHPELYERLIAEGHQVGNHTYNHLGSFKHWTATYLFNVHRAQIAMHDRPATSQPLFRPPHGWMRWSVYYWLCKEYRVIMWDLVTRDYSKWLHADDVLNNVKRYARNGSIITFHDSLKSIDKLRTALPAALQWLQEQGYEFKTF